MQPRLCRSKPSGTCVRVYARALVLGIRRTRRATGAVIRWAYVRTHVRTATTTGPSANVPGVRIAVVNLKGGCAKTTTSVLLAEAAAQQHGRALLVDADPQAGATTWANKAGAALSSAVVGMATTHLPQRLAQLGGDWPVTVIDTGAGQPELSLAALVAADVALIPVSPAMLDIFQLGMTLELPRRTGTPIAILITRARYGSLSLKTLRDLLEAQALPVLATVVPERQELARAPGEKPSPKWVGLHAAILAEIEEALGGIDGRG